MLTPMQILRYENNREAQPFPQVWIKEINELWDYWISVGAIEPITSQATGRERQREMDRLRYLRNKAKGKK